MPNLARLAKSAPPCPPALLPPPLSHSHHAVYLWKGAPSRVFLEESARQVKARGGRIVNIDATLIAERPKIFPHIGLMKERVAAALGLPVNKVGIKATTNERMGFLGREEGIAAMAVASVDLPE